jgi:spore coat-associated protein N
VVSSRAIIGSGLTFGNVLLTAGSTNNLRVTLTLPSTAGNTLQGLTSVISYAFTGTQRAATNK